MNVELACHGCGVHRMTIARSSLRSDSMRGTRCSLTPLSCFAENGHVKSKKSSRTFLWVASEHGGEWQPVRAGTCRDGKWQLGSTPCHGVCEIYPMSRCMTTSACLLQTASHLTLPSLNRRG